MPAKSEPGHLVDPNHTKRHAGADDTFDKEQIGPESHKPAKPMQGGPDAAKKAVKAAKQGPQGL